MIKINPAEYKIISRFIKQRCGINLGDQKAYLVETRLSDLVLEYGCSSYREFYGKAEKNPALVERIVDAMTTNETSWFRDIHIWKYLEQNIIPNMVTKGEKARQVRVWVAASSTGQEIYSFLMLLNEYLEKRNKANLLGRFEFFSTDISPSVLFQAKSGRYSSLSIKRGLPEKFKNKYFKNSGNIWIISEALRTKVNFKKLNLLGSLVALGKFDLVFCRNVLIYFDAETKKDIINRIASQINSGGILLLGSTESLREFSDRFDIVNEKNIIINYLRK